MATFALITLRPAGYLHVAAFFEWRLLLFHALRELGHEVVLATNEFPSGATPVVFGAHLIGSDLPIELPKGCILINTEQLSAHPRWLEELRGLSRCGHVIWDYSSENVRVMRAVEADARIHRMRLGYHPQLERVPARRDDSEGFVFYGSVTPYRQNVLSRIKLSERLRMQGFFAVYGWHRDGLLARSLAVVNIHSHPARILEWPRILFLIANRIPCVALLHASTIADDDQLSYVLPADEQCPTQALEAWFSQPEALRAHALAMQERFREEVPQSPIVEALLDQTLSHGFAASELPLKSPRWRVSPLQCDPDPSWYRHTHPWIALDPRSLVDYHWEVGAARQYHPNPGFAEHFRRPLVLSVSPQRAEECKTRMALAVVLHFYSSDRARLFFANYGCHLAPCADFYVSTSLENMAVCLRNLASEYGVRMEIEVIPNRGRDLASKYCLFVDKLVNYDLVFYSHGKDSSSEWFHDHNRILVGSRERIEAILDLFVRDPELGLLFPDYLPSLVPLIGWGSMRSMVDELLAVTGRTTAEIELLEFPAGGIFWARPRSLKLIHDLGLRLSDLPEEPLGKDHTLLHAIERMPCISCEMMGYRWEKLARVDDVSLRPFSRDLLSDFDSDADGQADSRSTSGERWGMSQPSPLLSDQQPRQVSGASDGGMTIGKASDLTSTANSARVLDWDLSVDVPCPEHAAADLSRVARWLQQQPQPISVMHFHHYDRLGYLPLLWRRFLCDVKAAGLTVFVTTCSGFDADARNFLDAEGIVAIRRPNRGRCIAAFRETALLCQALAPSGLMLQALVMINDSTLPISVDSSPLVTLQALVESANASVPVLAGLTDSFERGYHLQSFCLAANRALLMDPAWSLFWMALEPDLNKHDLVGAGEVGLSTCLASAGVKLQPLFPLVDRLLPLSMAQQELKRWNDMTFDRLNASLFLPRTLLEEGCPFVKKLALFAVPASGLELAALCLERIAPERRSDFCQDLNRLLVSRNFPKDGSLV